MTTSGSSTAFDASISIARIGTDQLEQALEDRAAEMQRLGITRGVLVADRRGASWRSDAVNIDATLVAGVAERHDDVFTCALGIDPTAGISEIRNLRHAVDRGFVAAHIVPHAFGLPPDDRSWFPAYAACAELGIPIQVELGVHRSRGSRVMSVGRPITLDEVACEFPELKIVALGPWPWTEEAISIAYKHPNVYLAVGGNDPGSSHPSLARFADSWGRGKVLFASMGAPPATAMSTVDAFDLRTESAQKCMNGVARELFEQPRT